MRTEVVLPTSIAQNRVYIPYINKLKKIFNFLGFSYRSNKWYIDKINNISTYIDVRSFIVSLVLIISFIFYFKFFFTGTSFSLFVLWKSIEISEEFFASILMYIYCFFISLKVYTWKLLFNKNIFPNNNQVDNYYKIHTFNDSELGNSAQIELDNHRLLVLKYLYKSSDFPVSTKKINKIRTMEDIVLEETDVYSTIHYFKYPNTHIDGIDEIYFNCKRILANRVNNKNNNNFYNLNLNFQNFKNLKLNQWFSKYNGLNSTNYGYYYGINTKFNLISDMVKLFNINSNDDGISLYNNKSLEFFLKNTESSFFNSYINYSNFLSNSNSWILNKINLLQLMPNNNNYKTIFKIYSRSDFVNSNIDEQSRIFFLYFKNYDFFNLFVNFNYYNIKLGSNFNNKNVKNDIDLNYLKKIFFFKK